MPATQNIKCIILKCSCIYLVYRIRNVLENNAKMSWTANGKELQIRKIKIVSVKIDLTLTSNKLEEILVCPRERATSFVYKTYLLKYPVAFHQGDNLICLNTLLNVLPACWKSRYYQQKNLSSQALLQCHFIVLKKMKHNSVTALSKNITRSFFLFLVTDPACCVDKIPVEFNITVITETSCYILACPVVIWRIQSCLSRKSGMCKII